jgi:phosphate transport system substrate-binding protein
LDTCAGNVNEFTELQQINALRRAARGVTMGIYRMSLPGLKRRIRLPILCFMACCASASQNRPQRLFVERFVTRTQSQKLREDLIGALRKTGSIQLADSESGADLILGGGGEIWIRGYRSLNPRSGRSPSAGTPVYGGYLSVELRDRNGDTLWSYLASPGTGSGDASKELSKQIAKRVAEAVGEVAVPSRAPPPAQTRTVLEAAGATFPYPVYAKWIKNYGRQNPGTEIVYDAIGSEAGIRRLLAGSVDFGASDNPEAIREIAPSREAEYLLFPSVAGAVVPIVNLPGLTGDISFTPEALAGIYLGDIKKWSDPILRKANPRLHLPDLDIVVVHRSDGSGTSYAWSQYLSKVSPAWSARAGSGFNPHWPAGRGATGNEGVAALVKEVSGSIGYVEYIYALQNHLSFGRVRNLTREFVEASLESIAAAANGVAWSGNFKISIVNSAAVGAYPISTFTWFVIPAHIADETKRGAIVAFLRWMLGPGQTQAAALGYVSLPRDIVRKEEEAIARIH